MKSFDLNKVGKRVRVVFGDDNEKTFTNKIISVMDFLQDIDGAIVFYPQQQSIGN